MSLLIQIREEACRLADQQSLVIMDRASANMIQNRFARLRKHATWPVTEQEQQYMHALSQYVYHKMLVRRITNQAESLLTALPQPYWYHQRERDRWREEMDRIEYLWLAGAAGVTYRYRELSRGLVIVESDEIAEFVLTK